MQSVNTVDRLNQYAIAKINEFAEKLNRRVAQRGGAMPIRIGDAIGTLEEMFPGSTTE